MAEKLFSSVLGCWEKDGVMLSKCPALWDRLGWALSSDFHHLPLLCWTWRVVVGTFWNPQSEVYRETWEFLPSLKTCEPSVLEKRLNKNRAEWPKPSALLHSASGTACTCDFLHTTKNCRASPRGTFCCVPQRTKKKEEQDLHELRFVWKLII